ncbi:MAG: PAS domain-containing protein [Parvibaculaceae bacterium]
MGLSDFIWLKPELPRTTASATEDPRARDIGDHLTVPHHTTPLDQPQHPEIIAFTEHLSRLAGDRRMADRADINPANMLTFLPHLMILDVIGDGDDFRVRVFGTGLVSLTCEERTGMLASEFGTKQSIEVDHEEMRTRWLKVFRRAYHEVSAIHFKAPTVSPDRSYMHYHGMFAPLSKGSDNVAQIIGMMIAVRP